MSNKLLIANRGEIACRVIRSAKRMGIRTVAVFSDADRDAPHTLIADEAVHIGASPSAKSYLVVERIIDACRTTGADAVHPGYGFLSENADFARAITEKNVAFIGPPPEAIEIMGDKLSAREAAEKVGVSGVPGTSDLITDPEEVKKFASEHGWPVAVKAAYGGGGRGEGDEQASRSLYNERMPLDVERFFLLL